jgi:mannobiose 2-epimerase
VYRHLADEIESNLQKEILDRWFPAAADTKEGGFHENFNLDWTRGSGDNKSIVYQSRLTWTAAQAALRFPEKADMYRALTRRGAACLANRMWDKQNGGFHWTVGPDGSPLSPDKQMYGHAFGIYALTASYQATQDPATLELAKKAFLWLEAHAHDNVHQGYVESVGADGQPMTTGRNAVGAVATQKSMNTSIHLLEALTALYRVWPDPLLKTRVEEMLDICRDKIYSEPGFLHQFLTADWKPLKSPDSFGHDVEAGFLMVEAMEALGKEDPQVWTAAQRLVDHALQYGWDGERGGLYDTGEMDDQGAVTGGLRTEKIWWVQAESLNALLLLHTHRGHETTRYWEVFLKQWDWIQRHQIDPVHGGWWATVEADGRSVSRVKSDMWTECYHQGRALLNVSARLRELAASRK